MTIIRDGDAPRFGEDGVSVTGLASPSRGCATVSAWRVLLEPGAGSPGHTLTSDEAFVALRGAARVTLDGTKHDLRPVTASSSRPSASSASATTGRSRSRPSAAWRPAGGRSWPGRAPSFRPGPRRRGLYDAGRR